jgi:Spy/CpxP family protein refolding chaperone
MNARLIRHSLSVLAIVALSGSIALTQQTPAPAPSTAPAPAAPANPGMRRPTMRPGMQGRPGMMQHGMPQRGRSPQMMHSRFRGGPGGSFHGRPQEGGGMGFRIGPEGMWWKNPMVVQRLSLTADQTKKMDDIFQQSRLQLIDLKADVEKAQVMLEPMLSANPLDVPRASAQIDKVAQARADLEKANAKMLLGIRGVLTPDQWTKLRDRRFGEGPGGPGGAPGAEGSPGPQGGQAPGGGRSRGMSRGGQTGSTTNLIDPIDQP